MSSNRRHVLSPDVPDFQGKRASLPYTPSHVELGELRFSRQLSTSQPKLPSKSSSSIENLLPVERARSNSLIRIADIKRNLSASNLAALSDSNLSIKKALPLRSYDAPNSSGSAAKLLFVQLVKRYYYQLTEGCGNEDCQNRFCHSCRESRGVHYDVAAIISIRLASSQRRHLCQTENSVDRPLPQDVFQPSNGAAKPFLHTLFSTSPFKSLFSAPPLPSEPKRKTSIANPQPGSKGVASTARASLNERLINAKPPSGAVRKGLSPLRSKGPGRRRSLHSGSVSNGGDSGQAQRQNGLPGWESSTSMDPHGLDQPGIPAPTWPRGHSAGLARRSSTPDFTMGASGEADATHLLSDDFSSEENLLIHHSRSRSTPAGSYGNLSMSSAISFGSGPPDSYPSMTSSPARLLSSQEALDETDDLQQFERALSLETSWDGVGEFSLTHLTLPMLEGAIETYKSSEDPSFLINTIRTVFTSPEALNASFRVDDSDPESPIDLAAVRQAYALLWTLTPLDVFLSTMTNALEILLMSLDTMSIQADQINQILILLENPLLERPELLRIFCHVIAHLPVPTHQALVRALSAYSKKHFQRLLQLIKNYLGSVLRPNQSVHENIICIAKVLSILYEASSSAQCDMIQLAILKDYYSDELSRNMDYMGEFYKWKLHVQQREKASAKDCGTSTASNSGSCCSGPSKEQAAYSRNVSNASTSSSSSNRQSNEMESLLDFPFLLDPASKVHILHLDAVMQMRQEYQAAILHQARVYQAQKYLHNPNKNALKDSIKAAMCPFLVLEVRRDFLIRDTLAQMRLKHRDLKKPLKIKYVGGGEQGLDMGGLQKEFFQLITEAVFDPKYAMFTFLKESRTLWINGGSLESRDEFELVGSLLGLAIYNGIILDVHFPTAIYKKLHGETMDLQDLMEVQPSLGRGLQELLAYDREDVETAFCQTFQISYTSMGEVVTVDLLPNGSQVAVTNENRDEFVRLYVQHILVDSIASQFEAFAHGFQIVCGGSALRLFQAAETEMLVCGSPELDFQALEASTTYEDGYSLNHPTVVAFWRIVHSLTEEKKRKLLHFITGSDKVPLKGLSSLPIVIQRNGPESDRLPTAMTCFNRLLLPAYSSQAILSQKLLVAIENSKGFGLT